jgi:hypothetical protein
MFVVMATDEPSVSEKVFSLTTVEMSADPFPVAVTTVVTGTSTAPLSGIVEISPVGGVGAGAIAMLRTFVAVPPPVTWTVKDGGGVAVAAVGVPLITPVEAFRVSPAGRLPAVTDQLYGVVPPVAASD